MSGEAKATVLLEHYLKQLKLPSMLREHAKLAAVCQQDRADYQTYLLRLAEVEIADRERRAAERRVRAARFPVIKTLDTFDFSAQPSINQALVRQLLRGEYLDQRENVLFIGNSGTGKTHLATALAFAACQQGRSVRFFTATGLVTQLLERRQDRELERLQRQLERLELIVLDELGYVPFSKAGAELLFDVVGRAYERTSLMLTTNLPFEEWTDVMGSERLTGALLDRLTHRVHIMGGSPAIRRRTVKATASAKQSAASKARRRRRSRKADSMAAPAAATSAANVGPVPSRPRPWISCAKPCGRPGAQYVGFALVGPPPGPLATAHRALHTSPTTRRHPVSTGAHGGG